jgi:hypothetical protein
VVSLGEFLPEGGVGGFQHIEIYGEAVGGGEGIEDVRFV